MLLSQPMVFFHSSLTSTLQCRQQLFHTHLIAQDGDEMAAANLKGVNQPLVLGPGIEPTCKCGKSSLYPTVL